MRLYSYQLNEEVKVGAERDGRLVALPFKDMLELIQGGSKALDLAQKELRVATASRDLDEVELLAPIPRPGKIFCSGLNYRGHLAENPRASLLADPRFFVKVSDAVIAHGKEIIVPPEPFQVDYEVELAVIIGRTMFRPRPCEIMDHVFGYTILNDVSARRIQFKDGNEDMGKNFDTFAPMGPCIVTADEIPDPENLRLRLWLNDELMQDGDNHDWCFSLPRLLAWLSMAVTLRPGDIVSTGTPAGTGFFRNPQVFLKPGDHCRLQIDRIGRLENRVVGMTLGHSEWNADRTLAC